MSIQCLTTPEKTNTPDEKQVQASQGSLRDELPESTVIVNFISSGAFGSVFECVDHQTKQKFAIKRVERIFSCIHEAKRTLREIKILQMLSPHPNIIEMHRILPQTGRLNDFSHINLVLDYADADLRRIFQSNQFFSKEHVKSLMFQLLAGVQYIHSAGVVHRDLKPGNLLINSDCHLRICDFNLSRIISDVNVDSEGQVECQKIEVSAQSEDQKSAEVDSLPALPTPPPLKRALTEHVTTRWYRAPEIICSSPSYDTAVDMWSVGAIMAEILMMEENNGIAYERRMPLFAGRSCYPLSYDKKDPGAFLKHSDQLNVIFDQIGTPTTEDVQGVEALWVRQYLSGISFKPRKDFRLLLPNSDSLAIDLLNQLLQFDPKKRISAQDALHHPFFESRGNLQLSELKWPNRYEGKDESKQSLEYQKEYIQLELEWERQQNEDIEPLSELEQAHFGSNLMRPWTLAETVECEHMKLKFQRKKSQSKYKAQNERVIREMIWKDMTNTK